MKNALVISTTQEELLSNVDDGTNRLFINGSEIPSSSWVGTGNYTATVAGHLITIAKIDSDAGNIMLTKTGDYTYKLGKISTGGGGSGGLGAFAFEIDSRGHLICDYVGDEPDFEINSNGHLILTL